MNQQRTKYLSAERGSGDVNESTLVTRRAKTKGIEQTQVRMARGRTKDEETYQKNWPKLLVKNPGWQGSQLKM